MKPKTLLLTVTVLSLALPAAAIAQEQNRFLEMPVAELAQTWLLRDCGVADEPLLETAIARHAGELTPLFVRAWEEGPQQSLVAEIREEARSRFDRNQAALQDTESLGLSPEDAARAKSRSAEEYVTRSVESLETGYRSQALRGLYLVAGEEGRRIVEEAAEGEDEALSDTARLLLAGSEDDGGD